MDNQCESCVLLAFSLKRSLIVMRALFVWNGLWIDVVIRLPRHWVAGGEYR